MKILFISLSICLSKLVTVLTLMSLSFFALASEPDYVTVEMEIDINKSAGEVWAAVGDYCAIGQWSTLDCEITSGDGGIGTVRVLLGGRIVEILIAQTELSYGYTQPAPEGQFYDLYHGFMESRPVTADTSKMLYTLVFDASNMENQEAVEADIARRRTLFEGMLGNMKDIAEAR